jgi:hypothetical protein
VAALAERWNGRRWAIQRTPSLAVAANLCGAGRAVERHPVGVFSCWLFGV